MSSSWAKKGQYGRVLPYIEPGLLEETGRRGLFGKVASFMGNAKDAFMDPNQLRAAYKHRYGKAAPMAGFARTIGEGIKMDLGIDKGGYVLRDSTLSGGRIGSRATRYGGGIFTKGGWKEILYDTQQSSLVSTKMQIARLGAKRGLGGALLRFAGKAAGPALIAHQLVTEGPVEAAKTMLTFGAARYAFGAMGAAAVPLAIGAAAVGIGYAAYKTVEESQKYNRALRKVSFGNAASDIYGTAATMRQASVQAIQSSRINGRSALGHEANLMHY
jgi:hypothetical protein